MSPNKFIVLASILIICFASNARTSPFYGHGEDKGYKEEEKHIAEKVTEPPCGLVCKLDKTKDKVLNATKSAINNTKEAIKNAGKKVQEIYNKQVEEHNARHHKKEDVPIQHDKSHAEHDYKPSQGTGYGDVVKEPSKTDAFGKSVKDVGSVFGSDKTEQGLNNAQSAFDQGLSNVHSNLNHAFDNSQSTFDQGLSNVHSNLNHAFDSSQSTFNQAADNAASGLQGSFLNAETALNQAAANAESSFQSGTGSTGFGRDSSLPSSAVGGYADRGTYSGGTVFNPIIPAANGLATSPSNNQQPGTLQQDGALPVPAIPGFSNIDQNTDFGFQSGTIGQRGGKAKEPLEKEKHSSSY